MKIIQLIVFVVQISVIGHNATAQVVRHRQKDFTYGLQSGIALTNYANHFVAIGKEAVKPVVGLFLEKPLLTKLSWQVGMNYTPHTIISFNTPVISKDHFHYLQLNLKGFYSLTQSRRWPLSVSGGVFGSRLVKYIIKDYDPTQQLTFVNSDLKGTRRAYNAGMTLGVWVDKQWERHQFRFGAEWQRGLMHVNSKEAVALLRLEPKTRAYWITLTYGISTKGQEQNKGRL